jgi:pyruvate kinase
LNLPRHKTKIVCTIGPASRSETVIKELIKSGMNVARLNLAHGTLQEHRQDIGRIRSIAALMAQKVTILIDLPGPKIRIGKLLHEPLVLKKGDTLFLTTQESADKALRIGVNYKRLPESVSKKSIIYLNDGFIQLRVQEITNTEVRCRVIIGGQLFSHKGINLPGAKTFLEPVTERDLKYVDFGLGEGVDTFGLSFVEKAADIIKIKQFARERGYSINVIAKIERSEAVKNIDEILGVADAIMVARGDLGVQIPLQEVPAVQKRLIGAANLRGRPVITATQMLESMTENIRPTRAEVTDVANAILDGTDAVMLSEETAIGAYPVETVKMMARIAASIERQRRVIKLSSGLEEYFKRIVHQKKVSIEDVISLNVIETMRALKVRFILTPTDSGSTPRRISRFKPDCWILAFSRYERTQKFLTLSYGVFPFLMKNKIDSWHEKIVKFIEDRKLAKKGDKMIITEGVSSAQAGGTDSLRIISIDNW